MRKKGVWCEEGEGRTPGVSRGKKGTSVRKEKESTRYDEKDRRAMGVWRENTGTRRDEGHAV